MAVDLSLESAEKYLWTWLDLIRLGPRRFRNQLLDDESRYLSAAQFLFGSIVIYGALVIVGFASLQGVQSFMPDEYKRVFANDAKTFVARHVLYLFVSIVVGAVFELAVVRWVLKSQATIIEVLKAKFYGSAIFIPLAAADALAACGFAFVIPQIPSASVSRLFLVLGVAEILLMSAILILWNLWSLSSFCRLRVRRAMEGALIFQIGFTCAGASIGGFIGGMAGGMIAAWNATPVHDRTSVLGLLLAFAVTSVISLLLGAIPICLFFLALRMRLPKLRRLVASEYVRFQADPPPKSALSPVLVTATAPLGSPEGINVTT